MTTKIKDDGLKTELFEEINASANKAIVIKDFENKIANIQKQIRLDEQRRELERIKGCILNHIRNIVYLVIAMIITGIVFMIIIYGYISLTV